eukprot:scaffold7386_cov509-Prasinococcus_capsulatus_cf.AAC.9
MFVDRACLALTYSSLVLLLPTDRFLRFHLHTQQRRHGEGADSRPFSGDKAYSAGELGSPQAGAYNSLQVQRQFATDGMGASEVDSVNDAISLETNGDDEFSEGETAVILKNALLPLQLADEEVERLSRRLVGQVRSNLVESAP